jgi:hypothetical protein
MDKGLKYDIKEASNSQLTESARKNYGRNAEADVKSGINMMGKATMGDRTSPLNYSGNNMKLQSGMNMNADLAYNPVEDIAGQGTEGMNTGMMMKKDMSPMNRQKYGGNKGDESMSDRDYSSPASMYGGKKGDMSKSRKDY